MFFRRERPKVPTLQDRLDAVKAAGFRWQSVEQAERLRGLLAVFSDRVTSWLSITLPRYARGW